MSVRELTLGALPAVAVTAAEGTAPADPETTRLARLAMVGDRDAFAALVDRHQQGAWRVAMAALGRPDEAEEAAQEAFIAAWRHLASLREPERFRSWLLSIVWRKALDRRRGLRTWLRHFAPGSDDTLWTIESSPDDVRSAEDRLVARGTAMAARNVIAGLPRRLRDPLLLAASGEHRYEDIAGLLGIPLGTVKWRVSEARRLVRQKLERLEGARS